MERGSKSTLLENDNGVYGICLGSDFTADHEWGIDRIKTRFGVDSSKTGIAGRQITRGGDWIQVATDKHGAYLFIGLAEDKVEYVRRSLKVFKSDKLVGAWSSSQFGFFIAGERGEAICKEFQEAFLLNDIAFTFLNAGGLANPGLTLLIVSKCEDSVIEAHDLVDREAKRLNDADEFFSADIRAKLKAAGKNWYALSAKFWASCEKTTRAVVDTGEKVMFWLNPSDQRNVNYGWFTLEELEQWLNDEGPIPMTAEQKRKNR
jgi:hypothetical protein